MIRSERPYTISADMTPEEAAWVQRKVVEFSDAFTAPRNPSEIGFILRDEAGEAVGGITASTAWDWLQIINLWVAEALRGGGLGSRLLATAEDEGRRRGCKHARLNTFEFQAREFYARHGYRVRSQTDDFPEGHTQYHMEKEL